MKKITQIIKLSYVSFLFLSAYALLISCSDKKEYQMELAFQKQATARSLHENDRTLMRIQKTVIDNGKRPEENVLYDHAAETIQKRNASLSSVVLFNALLENIKKIKNAEIIPTASVKLLDYYQKKLEEGMDSLAFQKLINVYLVIESNILQDDLMQVSGCCNWGWSLAHISKTTDTITKGDTYELAVVPDRFNTNYSLVKDDCKFTVYKNDEPVVINYSILKKGSVYLITLNPIESGNYKIRGSFTMSSRMNSYSMPMVFGDWFVVK